MPSLPSSRPPYVLAESDSTVVSSSGDYLDNTKVPATHHAEPTSPSSTGVSAVQERPTIQPLPKGAMALSLSSLAYNVRTTGLSDTPPSTPSQRLLDSDPPQVQFATFHNSSTEKIPHPPADSPQDESSLEKGWVPWPLRPYFWVPFVLILVLGAVGLEIALHFSNKNKGWPTSRNIGRETGILHYVYTLPPVTVAAIVVALWAWTDIEIKKMQPLVDLVHGDSPPHRSLLLDYTRTNNFVVWTKASRNKHYLVALASLMVLLSLAFQPLAAALLVVKDTWFQTPDFTMKTLAAIGLNQDLQFQDLTSFVSAAGFASASVLYRLGDSPFVRGPYTVTPFQLPLNVAKNGTVFANTTAIKSNSGCLPAPLEVQYREAGGIPGAPDGWTITAHVDGCATQFLVSRDNADNIFGIESLLCIPGSIPGFEPILFWFFSFSPNVTASAVWCTPSLSFWDASVSVDLATNNVTQVTELRPFTPNSSVSANITGEPLLGRAYNGIYFNLTGSDLLVNSKLESIKLQMSAAVYQAAVQSSQGLAASYQADDFVSLTARVYTTYLTLFARNVYTLPHQEDIVMHVKTFKKRVWLSSTAVHLLSAGMFILAFFGTIVHLFHRADRRRLHLRHLPGTIASAVSIGAQTGMGNLLAGRQDQKDIQEALRNRKFRIDPRTMKIVMEGEEGYESARSPTDGRKSVFAALQGQNRLSKRFSTFGKPTPTPNTPPRTPRGNGNGDNSV